MLWAEFETMRTSVYGLQIIADSKKTTVIVLSRFSDESR